MHTALYVIWFLIPSFFFVMALWAALEKLSDRQKRENIGDFFWQGLFVLGCVLVSILIDQYVLIDFAAPMLPEFVPLGFLQVILLPVVLLIAAKLIGGSKPLMISGPHSKNQKRKR